MANRWALRRLADLASLHGEQLDPAKHADKVFQLYSIPAFDQTRRPDKAKGSAIGSNKFTVPADAVLVSKLNPRIPRVWEPDIGNAEESLASTEFLVLRPKPGISARFLRYLCLSPAVRSELQARATGTSGSHQRVRPEDALAIEVLVPLDANEQIAIARILGALDDKIELNRRMSETLEAIARALFKSWFVDFDPVRAKAEGRDPGLPEPIADLFPDRFEDSELGMIPAGWVIGPVGTLAELAIGGDWGRDRPLDGDVEVRCLRGVDIDLLRRTGWSDAPKRYVSRASYEKRRPKPTDVLVEGSGQCGRSLASSEALTGVFLEPIIYSNFCKRLVTPSPDHALYLEYVLNDLVASGEMTNFVTGTAMPNLDHHGLLKGSMIVLPPTPVLVQFGRFAEVVRSRLFSPESRTLAEIRDALLPKLISGELRVPQAERLLEAAPA
ncbi:MAG TPA: restriction endonuclease subunit S [candidate division Zixibacteria bacterium]|nr:restriction endonuclease subunit S [candidate division Zixibacteria bacterium]